MSQFLRKTLIFRTTTKSAVSLHNPNAGSLRFRLFSISSKDDKEHSFTDSYLINSLGFNPKTAQSASKFVKFENSEKPDKAIEFFTNSGFTRTQISTLVRNFPQVLVSNTEKRVLPKLEFLKSKGLSVPEMTKALSYYPNILSVSLTNQIIPSYDYLRNFTQSDEKLVLAFKRCPGILRNFEYVTSNTEILLEHGVPGSEIARFVHHCPWCFAFVRPDRFRKVVEEISEMGFDASTTKFAIAIRVSIGLSESTRRRKVEAYKKCGFSGEEVSRIFRRDPNCMLKSEGKISAVMGFFVNEMNWKPSLVALFPMVFGLSLEKRIVPRCLVFKALISKGLFKKRFEKKNVVSLVRLLGSSEEIFLKRYVEAYEKEAPELLRLYREKLVGL